MNQNSKNPLLYEDVTYKIRGAAFDVYNKLGFGHKEVIYQKALAREFEKRKVNFIREPKLDITYEGEKLGKYTPDFLVEEKVIVELKSAINFPPNLDKQLIHYLKATSFKLALAINFGTSKLQIIRRIMTN